MVWVLKAKEKSEAKSDSKFSNVRSQENIDAISKNMDERGEHKRQWVWLQL